MNRICSSSRILFLIVVCWAVSMQNNQQRLWAQTFSQNNNVTSLIQDFFITGDCASVSNITYTGANGAIGTFAGGSAALGMGTGIIIATGNVTNAAGPNNGPGTTTDFTSGNLAILNQASPSSCADASNQDAAYIQFDFIPVTSTISFNYAFASEEYEEYVGSQFNDVFGFFIDGPGINGPYNFGAYTGMENIALVPGTNTPVAINSINQSVNTQYYLNSSSNSLNIEYDGITTVLTATTDVTPCQTYHLILAIQDVCDGAFDSAVFLESGSFDAGQGGVVSAGADGGSGDVLEGCVNGYFLFERAEGADASQPLEIQFSIGGTASAADYNSSALISPVILPPGVESVTIPIIANADNITEGSETVTITILNSACICDGPGDPIELTIFDAYPMNVSIASDVPCVGAATLSATATGALVNLGVTYSWSSVPAGGPYPSGPTISVTPAVPTTYTVTVTDICGAEFTSTADVQPGNSQVAALLPPPPPMCQSADPITLADYVDTVNGDAGGVWTGNGVSGGLFDPAGINGSVSLTYTVGDLACGGQQATLTITVTDQLTPALGSPPPICEFDGVLDLSAIDDPAFTGTWTASSGTISGNQFSPNGASGNIVLTFTPDTPCSLPATTSVQVTDYLSPTLTNPENFCSGTLTSLNLNDFADPALPGTWAAIDPPGIVSGNTANVNGLNGTITIGYTPLQNCSESGQITFSITDGPTFTLTEPVCTGDGNKFSFDVIMGGDPGAFYLLSGNATAGANPNSMLGGETATFTLNGNGQNVLLNAYVPGSTDCNFELSFTAPLCICPTITPANVDQIFCGQEYLSLDLSIGGASGLSNLQNPGGTLHTGDADGDGIDWFTAPDPTPGNNANLFDVNSITPDHCNTTEFSLYAYVRCDGGLDGFAGDGNDQYIAAGDILVTIYPDIDLMDVQINTDSPCCPFISSWECQPADGWDIFNDFDDNNEIPDCTQEQNSGTIIFTFRNYNVPLSSPCRERQVSVDYDCRQCPELTTPADDTQYFCGDDGGLDLDPATIGLAYEPGLGVGEYVAYYFDQNHQVDYSPGLTANNDCEKSETTIYVFIVCDYYSDGSDLTYIPAGEVEVVVFPDLTNTGYELNNDDPCCPKIEYYDCAFSFASADYTISNNIDPANDLAPDCSLFSGSGVIQYTIENISVPAELSGSPCASFSFDVPYTCTECPLPDPVSGEFDYCYNSAITLQQIINDQGITVNYIPPASPVGVEIKYYLTDGAIPADEVNLADIISPPAGHCDPSATVIHPYLLCDLNNDGFSGAADDTYFPAGSFTVNIYPDLSQMIFTPENVGGCCPSIISWECDGESGFSFTNDIDISNNLNPDCDILGSSSGTITWTVSNINFPAACNVAEFEVAFSCACPTSTAPAMNVTICDNTIPDLSSFETQVLNAITDPQNQAFGSPDIQIFWYTDAAYTNLYNNTALQNNADGCGPEVQTLYAVIVCMLNDSKIDAGVLSVAVLPDYSVAFIDETPNGCNEPSIQTTCPDYTISLLSSDGNLQPGENGTTEWTITYDDNGLNCWSEIYPVVYSCPPNGCPAVTGPYNDSFTICNGDTPAIDLNANITYDDPDGTAGSLLLYTDSGLSNPFNNNFSYTGNNCSPYTFTLYIGLECSLDNSVQSAGSLGVTVYPDFDNSFINDTPGDCGPPALTASCAEYVITPQTSVPAVVIPGDNGAGDFIITYNDGNLSCWEETVSVSYSCPNPGCPTVTTPLDIQQSICDGGTVAYTSFENQIVISDSDGHADGFLWYANQALTTPLNSATISYNGDGCNPYEMTIYAGLLCDLPGIAPVSAGEIAITIYPPYNDNLLDPVPGTCVPPVLTATCAQYIITPQASVPVGVNPGDNGQGDFIITYNDGNLSCWEETVSVSYSCPNPGCPTVTTPLDAQQSICDGGTVAYTSFENQISINDPDGHADGFMWYANQGLTIPLSPATISYNGDGCNPYDMTIYAGLLCDLPNAQPISAGTIDITIFPPFDGSLLTEQPGNCVPPDLFIDCTMYQVITNNLPTIVNPGENDNTEFTLSYEDNGLNCWTEVILVPYSCADPNCPSLTTGVDEAFTFCNGEILDLAPLESSILYNDPENHFDGIEWYADAALTNVYAAGILSYAGDGCSPHSFTVYAGLLCDLPGNGPQPAGSIDVTVYPDFDNLSITATEGDCAPPVVIASCASYVITPDINVPSVVIEGDSGSGDFIITYEDGGAACWSQTISVAYDCPACTPLNADIIPPAELCEDSEPLMLNSLLTPATTPGGTWSAGPGISIVSNSIEPSANTIGSFEITYTVFPPQGDPEDCPDAFSSVDIIINPLPELSLQPQAIVCNVSARGSIIELDNLILSGDMNGEWTIVSGTLPDGIQPPILDFDGTEAATYTFSYTTTEAADPCEDISATTSIVVQDCTENHFWIPTAFSPNGDGQNDVFMVGGSQISALELMVFDRWGTKLYQTTSFGQGWDGTIDGHPAEVEVYVYWAKITFTDGEEIFSKGNVTLLR